MDKTALVKRDIALGREFVTLLETAPSVRLEAAFWWLDEGEWEFIVATPVVHERGRMGAMTEIEHALGHRFNEFKSILDRIRVLSPSEGRRNSSGYRFVGKPPEGSRNQGGIRERRLCRGRLRVPLRPENLHAGVTSGIALPRTHSSI